MLLSGRLAQFLRKLTKECVVMKSISKFRLGALLLGGVGICAGTGFALNPAVNNGSETQKTPLQIREDDNPLVRDVKDGTSFAPIVRKVAPSVVKVFVTMKETENPMSNPDMEFFRRFFGDNGLSQMNPGESPTEHGLGQQGERDPGGPQ
jgi:S1-C subfamily serine protease